MAVAADRRAKRITSLLDEKVRARLLDEKVRARLRGEDDHDESFHQSYQRGAVNGGYASSGSDHDGGSVLSGFIDGFFFFHDDDDIDAGEPTTSQPTPGAAAAAVDVDDPIRSGACLYTSMVRSLTNGAGGDPFRAELAAEVSKAAARFGRSNSTAFRRAVMGSLRSSGHDAGVCRSKWDSGGGVTAGTYEYIDVVRASSGERYIVDLEFSAEFEIARATAEYEKLVAELPAVFVGRAEELKKAVRLLAEAAKRSMRASDMNLPPWRKAKYMHNKWLGPYKRTTNAGEYPPPPAAFGSGRELKYCREIGFLPARQVIIPAAKMR